MREILFKAKEKHDKDWVYGLLSKCEGEYTICNDSGVGVFIDESTICQYTGLTDRNGSKIWENDIVEIPAENGCFLIEWNDTEARWQMNNEEERLIVDFDNYWHYEVEVIGSAIEINCRRPRTNADRIRAMSDEELKEFFFRKFVEWNKECDKDKFADVIFTREERFMQWLKAEPVKEEKSVRERRERKK